MFIEFLEHPITKALSLTKEVRELVTDSSIRRGEQAQIILMQ